MNLLLLLTALLTSLTGMISGDRALATPAAAAVAAERAVEVAQAAAVSVAAIALVARPAATLPTLRGTNTPLTPAFALIPALRLTAEKRRQ